jgi:lipoate-protein ligase B
MTLPAEKLPETSVIVVRTLGMQDYEPLWRGMQQFTESRSSQTPDEIWFTEHPPVFTLGLNASRDHLLAPGNIPVIQVDRGGQVTYHGPGQLMIYPMIDIKRARLGVRDLVTDGRSSISPPNTRSKRPAARTRPASTLRVARLRVWAYE